MTNSPMRFRPRFSLRTLFVLVTIIALPLGWVAYQLNWIRQRHALNDWAKRHDVKYIFFKDSEYQPSWVLWLFGEPAYAGMLIHLGTDESESEIEQLKRAIRNASFGLNAIKFLIHAPPLHHQRLAFTFSARAAAAGFRFVASAQSDCRGYFVAGVGTPFASVASGPPTAISLPLLLRAGFGGPLSMLLTLLRYLFCNTYRWPASH